MRLLRPELTKLDLVFCKMYIPWLFRNNTFFLGSHFHFFGGQRDLFSEGITFFQNCGSFSRFVDYGGTERNCNGAANCQRTALAFAGKCRLVRRGGEWAAGEAWKWCKHTNTLQIRIQIHTERREIHKYKNTDTHKYKYCYWESQPDRRRRELRFFCKKSSNEKFQFQFKF